MQYQNLLKKYKLAYNTMIYFRFNQYHKVNLNHIYVISTYCFKYKLALIYEYLMLSVLIVLYPLLQYHKISSPQKIKVNLFLYPIVYFCIHTRGL